MNAARLAKSQRLQRVAALLRKHRRPLTTRDIVEKAHVVAVNSIVSELRTNGMDIKCRRSGSVWLYWMVRE